MTDNVTDIATKFRQAKIDPATTIAQIRRADEEIARIAGQPNELLPRLLDDGCEVTFRSDDAGTHAIVKMPDDSIVCGFGPAPVYALIDAYQEGAWVADLPAALAATAEG